MMMIQSPQRRRTLKPCAGIVDCLAEEIKQSREAIVRSQALLRHWMRRCEAMAPCVRFAEPKLTPTSGR